MINVNHTTLIVTGMLAFNLFLFVVLTNPYSYAQQIPSVSYTHPKTHSIRITSPAKGQQVPIGKDLSVSGISSTIGAGNATTKTTTPSTCQAYVIVNSVKPYQPVNGTGPGGAADYSKWNFVLTSKYTTIKPGPYNKITAKYICSSNPTSASFYSVNVTGVAADDTAQQKQYQNVTRINYANTTNKNNTEAVRQDMASVAIDNNNTIRNSNTGTGTSTHTNFESGKLIYLGSIKLPGEADNSKSTVLHNGTSDKSVDTISSHNTGYYSAVKTRDHHDNNDNNNSIPSGDNSQQVCSNYDSDTIVCSNENSQNVEAGKYLDQPNHTQEASTNSRSISNDNSITAATDAIITLPARTIPSQSATMTLTAQLNTPMTISIPGVGKVMATASQPIEGRTCPSISYQVNSDIGMLCLRIDWYTLS
jgi:hypothetical protein